MPAAKQEDAAVRDFQVQAPDFSEEDRQGRL
jgi:hypothetical protein